MVDLPMAFKRIYSSKVVFEVVYMVLMSLQSYNWKESLMEINGKSFNWNKPSKKMNELVPRNMDMAPHFGVDTSCVRLSTEIGSVVTSTVSI